MRSGLLCSTYIYYICYLFHLLPHNEVRFVVFNLHLLYMLPFPPSSTQWGQVCCVQPTSTIYATFSTFFHTMRSGLLCSTYIYYICYLFHLLPHNEVRFVVFNLHLLYMLPFPPSSTQWGQVCCVQPTSTIYATFSTFFHTMRSGLLCSTYIYYICYLFHLLPHNEVRFVVFNLHLLYMLPFPPSSTQWGQVCCVQPTSTIYATFSTFFHTMRSGLLCSTYIYYICYLFHLLPHNEVRFVVFNLHLLYMLPFPPSSTQWGQVCCVQPTSTIYATFSTFFHTMRSGLLCSTYIYYICYLFHLLPHNEVRFVVFNLHLLYMLPFPPSSTQWGQVCCVQPTSTIYATFSTFFHTMRSGLLCSTYIYYICYLFHLLPHNEVRFVVFNLHLLYMLPFPPSSTQWGQVCCVQPTSTIYATFSTFFHTMRSGLLCSTYIYYICYLFHLLPHNEVRFVVFNLHLLYMLPFPPSSTQWGQVCCVQPTSTIYATFSTFFHTMRSGLLCSTGGFVVTFTSHHTSILSLLYTSWISLALRPVMM